MFKADLIDDENPNDVRSVIVKKARARRMPMHTLEIPQWLLKDLRNCVASEIPLPKLFENGADAQGSDSQPHAQAKEFGEAEVWMNERLMRAAPQYFAEFITAFEDGEQRTAPQRGPVSQPSPDYNESAPLIELHPSACPQPAACSWCREPSLSPCEP